MQPQPPSGYDYFAPPPHRPISAPALRAPPAAPGPRPAAGSPAGAPAPAPPDGLARSIVVVLSVLGTLGVLVVLALVASIALPVYLNQRSERTLALPERAAGLHRVDVPDERQTLDQVEQRLTDRGMRHAVAGLYSGTPDGTRTVVVWGGAQHLPEPEAEVAAAFEEVERTLAPLLSQLPYPAGAGGGVLRCGDAAGQSPPTVFCVWADRGAILAALVFDRSQADAAALVGALRVDIVRRG